MWYKIKKVRIWVNWVEKQIYPAGWKPNANTIAYYPLTSTSTVNDLSWNSNNLTNSWATFWEYHGIDCSRLYWNFSDSWPIAYMYGNITWLPTWANARTYSFWCYNENSWNTTYVETYLFQWQASTNKMVLCASSNEFVWYYWISQYWSSWKMWDTPIIRWQRANHIITYDWSKFEWYVNWTSRWTWTYTINTWSNKLSIWWASENWWFNAFNWCFSEFIVENKARSADEITNYYNSTKSNYWL